MIRNQRLLEDITKGIAPDCWNPKWSQVNEFGGGMAVELEIGELLHSVVRATKPEVIIETGSHKGFSTLMIAQALSENNRGHIWSIDLFNHGVQAKCAAYGLGQYVTFIQGDSRQVIKDLSTKIERVDLLWLDADHSEEAVLSELSLASRMLRTGTLIALHDSLTHPSEDVAVNKIKATHPNWEHIRIMSARGFDLMRIP